MDQDMDEAKMMVKLKTRRSVIKIMEQQRKQGGRSVEQIVEDLQLSTIYQYEEKKSRATHDKEQLKNLECKEVAILELIAEVGREMTRRA